MAEEAVKYGFSLKIKVKISSSVLKKWEYKGNLKNFPAHRYFMANRNGIKENCCA